MIIFNELQEIGSLGWHTASGHEEALRSLDAKSRVELEEWTKEMTLLHMTSMTVAAYITEKSERNAYMSQVSSHYMQLCNLARQMAEVRSGQKWKFDPVALLRQTRPRRRK
jgi:hypothetical protein